LTLSEVTQVSGEEGRFQVEVLQQPRYIDMDKCIACGLCAEKCPKKIPDEYNAGLGVRKAAYVKYPQAVPLKYAIDAQNCIYFLKGKCRACEKFCPNQAVNFDEQPRAHSLTVGSIILAPGFETYDPGRYPAYAYSHFPNVITSLEFERILSASGPSLGHLIRPSDLNKKTEPPKEIRKIAWLQCVGSRDINHCDHAYCSSVCCMYAIKEAVIAKEHSKQDLDCAIFFMDMRTYGKDFERYYERAKTEAGVRFIRSRIHSVDPAENGDLILQYVDEQGLVRAEFFNLVVLSVGMETPPQVIEMAERFGVAVNRHGFSLTADVDPVATSRPGIYVCGSFQEPKDIPNSVMEASAAASQAEASLSPARKSLIQKREFPVEKEVAGEKPRIGVFVCNCGVNIGGIVNVPNVAEYARTLPGVDYVEENLFTCSQDTQDKMKEVIAREGLNRIVVAACTPRTHEPLFQETLRDSGLNKYLFEMANIRNQCSWVHSQEPEKATEKARDLVRMAVTRANLIQPLPQPRLPVNRQALVVGGGVSGMTAALNLAEQGFETHLVERSSELGGNARRLLTTWQGDPLPPWVDSLVDKVQNHLLLTVHLNTTLKQLNGFVGNFVSTLGNGQGEMVLEHGALVLATGGREYQPSEYRYGEDDRIMTQLEMDQALLKEDPRVLNASGVVFIQCVGSREPERPYCSRVCCTHTLKSAIDLKEKNPDRDCVVLYRDIRSYGTRETLYQKARDLGVLFIRFNREDKPRVEKTPAGGLQVLVRDHILDREVALDADLVCLAAAVLPQENQEMAQLCKVAVNEDGFFMEAHAKLRPVDFAVDGIFVAGLAHYPKPVEESISQALAAASRAGVVLSQDYIEAEGVVSHVDEALCRGCGKCVEICAYQAAELITTPEGKQVAHVNEAVCKGCGPCTVVCPTGAASLRHFNDRQVLKMLEAALAA
jgi:heterodisulfide reductase subunit A2